MALIVHKYGGTSVGSLERIRAVADNVVKFRQQGHEVVVVVSAMAGETDRLIGMAKELTSTPSPREYSVLVSTGEQVSMSLLAIELNQRGYEAVSLTGRQAAIKTDGEFKNARILDIDKTQIMRHVEAGKIVIVAGFQGVDEQGNITTLGRGGSDTSGVAVAAVLEAAECQIYTDVDGVYTADPRMVPNARRLTHITFEEMFELASLGAKVLQHRAVEFAGKYQVPLRVLSSFTEGAGTLITFEEKNMELPIVSGIAFNRKEAKLTIVGVPDHPGIASKILGPVSDANIGIDMIIQNIGKNETTDFTFTVDREDYQTAMQILQHTAEKLKARTVIGDDQIVKISMVGVGMRSHPGIANTMFTTLGREGINIQLIATSEIKVSVIVDEKYLELGVRALHDAFELDKEPEEEFDPT